MGNIWKHDIYLSACAACRVYILCKWTLKQWCLTRGPLQIFKIKLNIKYFKNCKTITKYDFIINL